MLSRPQTIIGSLLLMGALAFVGCGQGKQVLPPGSNGDGGGPGASPTPPGASPTPSPGSTPLPTPEPLSSGATAALTVAGDPHATLQDYMGGPLGQTGPVQINVRTSPTSNIFLGEMYIRFYELNQGNLILHSGVFFNGSHITNGNNVHVLTTDSSNGKPTHRIFFEDPYGMLILTLTPVSGSDITNMTGKVWYRNFQAAPNTNPLYYGQWNGQQWIPPNPLAYCWTGVIGPSSPFYCVNMSVPPAQSGSTAVKLLGTINSINGHTALGI